MELSPAPGEVWLVQRHEVPNQQPSPAQYQEDDDGDGTWHYFGTDWFDRAKRIEARDIRVDPLMRIYPHGDKGGSERESQDASRGAGRQLAEPVATAAAGPAAPVASTEPGERAMSGKKAKHVVTLAEALRTVSTTLKVQTEVGSREENTGLPSYQDGTGPAEKVLAFLAYRGAPDLEAVELADAAHREAVALADNGMVTWLDILLTEVLDVAASSADLDLRDLDRELVAVAATCVAWLKDRERRRVEASGRPEPSELSLPVSGIETTVLVDVRTEVVGEDQIEVEVSTEGSGGGGPEPVRDWTGQDADEVS